MTDNPAPVDRLAILYSDGSIGILPESYRVEDAWHDAELSNGGETDRRHVARVARVRIAVIETLAPPANSR